MIWFYSPRSVRPSHQYPVFWKAWSRTAISWINFIWLKLLQAYTYSVSKWQFYFQFFKHFLYCRCVGSTLILFNLSRAEKCVFGKSALASFAFYLCEKSINLHIYCLICLLNRWKWQMVKNGLETRLVKFVKAIYGPLLICSFWQHPW